MTDEQKLISEWIGDLPVRMFDWGKWLPKQLTQQIAGLNTDLLSLQAGGQDGGQAFVLQSSTDTSGLQRVLSQGQDVTDSLTSGSLGARLQFAIG